MQRRKCRTQVIVYMLSYIMLCHVMICYVMICYVILYHDMLCHVMLYYVMSCDVVLYHVILWHVMLCHIMVCYVMTFDFRSFMIFLLPYFLPPSRPISLCSHFPHRYTTPMQSCVPASRDFK